MPTSECAIAEILYSGVRTRCVRTKVPTLLCSAFLIASTAAAQNLSKVEKLAGSCHKGDQKACAELNTLAKTARQDYVRAEAVKSVKDQALLEDIVRTDESLSVCEAPVGSLTDQTVLADLAQTHRYGAADPGDTPSHRSSRVGQNRHERRKLSW